MLARLARWLRALGHDVLLAGPGEPDAAVVRRAEAEGRWLLTRDRALAADGARALGERRLLLRADAPLAQLLETRDALGLRDLALTFTRCLLCNAPLDVLDAEGPCGGPRRRCAACGRVYWEGSHTRRMRAALARALSSAP
ncbi:hypothetical protein rosag_22050 [Roseisolibacter agri]|uniref:Mut7-C RNAse domain-containing protein n=2 Tax=Roseisolibacter agri TaxID=2014610 RepID=A0AA37V2U0_9BACT|nr:hypothetical protein rosag_22050 [Roseisolibacter agri]